ncbi:MAG: NFACT family protein [Candidatus Micrarchaeia archaeon]
MRQMTSLEYMRIVSELGPLCGQRLDKFVDYGGKSFRLRIGKADIAIDAPLRINLTKYIRDSPQTPTDLAFSVRKRIANARLESVFQHEADRVVAFLFSKDGEEFTLVFEMFSTGNCVLLDKDSVCMAAAEYNEWKDREIRLKKPYKFPAPQVPREGMFGVEAVISGKYVSACLSRLPIGTIYTNEALCRLGIGQKAKGTDLTPGQAAEIGKELRGMAESQKPVLYTGPDGKPEEFALTELSGMEGLAKKEMPSLSECADEYYNANPAAVPKEDSGQGKEMARLAEMEARQQEHMAALEAQAKSSGDAGKAILANLALVEAAIEYAKKGHVADREMTGKAMALEKAGKLRIDRKTGRLEMELD